MLVALELLSVLPGVALRGRHRRGSLDVLRGGVGGVVILEKRRSGEVRIAHGTSFGLALGWLFGLAMVRFNC